MKTILYKYSHGISENEVRELFLNGYDCFMDISHEIRYMTSIFDFDEGDEVRIVFNNGNDTLDLTIEAYHNNF